MIDRAGPRKPWLALVTIAMIGLTASLWFARPDGAGLSIVGVCVVTGAIGVLFAYSEVLHNALLPFAATPSQTARASGLGLAMGNGFSVILLLIVLWAFALPGKLPLPFLPHAPLFGLSAAQHEPDRIVAPIQAVVFALGAIPLFLLSRDAPKGDGGGLRAGLAQLGETLRGLARPEARDMRTFLLARMLYTDGLSSILFFSGVFAAGVLGFNVLDLLAFGIILSIFGTLGGTYAATLDRWVGAKRAVQIEIAAVLVCEVFVLGFAKDRMFYIPWHGAPLWGGPFIKTVPSLAYLLLSCVNAVAITGAYASSRVLLTRLCPPERVGSYFGLYALSGTVTLWLGSLLVKTATDLGKSQQAGFVPIAGLLLFGLAGLSMVRSRGRYTPA